MFTTEGNQDPTSSWTTKIICCKKYKSSKTRGSFQQDWRMRPRHKQWSDRRSTNHMLERIGHRFLLAAFPVNLDCKYILFYSVVHILICNIRALSPRANIRQWLITKAFNGHRNPDEEVSVFKKSSTDNAVSKLLTYVSASSRIVYLTSTYNSEIHHSSAVKNLNLRLKI